MSVLAQSAPADTPAAGDDDRWSIGLGAGIRDAGYAGEGTRVRPGPLLTFEGERVFWRGITGGVHAIRGEVFGLDVIVAGRLDGFDIDDLGRAELARNGLDADLLEDRDDGLDAGLSASWRGRAGTVELSALADVVDASGGYEATAEYAYPLQWGRTTVVPGVAVRWMSDDSVDYYYGILDEEVARGVPAYRPGSAVVPQVSVGFSRPLGGKWQLRGTLRYEFLPDEITESPLMEPGTDGAAGMMIGVSRSF